MAGPFRLGAGFVLCGLLAVFCALRVWSDWQLDRSHVTVVATITSVSGNLGSDFADVTFPVDGSQKSARVEYEKFPVNFGRPLVGDKVTIEYRPDDPSRGRLAGRHDWSAISFGLVLALLSLISLLLLRRDLRDRGVLRRRRR